MNRVGLAVFIAAVLSACSVKYPSCGGERWVDLSYAFSPQTIYWPTDEDFKHETVFEGMTDKGYYYSSYKFSAEEHGGTHFDAPVHFAKGGRAIDEVPLERLMGDAVVIDVSVQAAADSDYQISPQDIMAWEAANGPIAEGSIVLLRTGRGKFWPDRGTYMGTALRGKEGVANLHFPGLHPEAAALLAKRRVKAVGLDTPSIDYGQSKLYESHRTLFANGITVYENVANLEQLPPRGAWVMALPMKIQGGSGAPLRIVARLD